MNTLPITTLCFQTLISCWAHRLIPLWKTQIPSPLLCLRLSMRKKRNLTTLSFITCLNPLKIVVMPESRMMGLSFCLPRQNAVSIFAESPMYFRRILNMEEISHLLKIIVSSRQERLQFSAVAQSWEIVVIEMISKEFLLSQISPQAANQTLQKDLKEKNRKWEFFCG